MKKIKIFLALIFSLACMFSLVACGGNNGYYVQNSFEEKISYYSTLGDAIVSAEFQVYLPDKATYEISFTLKLYYDDELIDQRSFTETRKSSGKQTVNMFEYWSADDVGTYLSEYDFELRLSGLTAKPKSASSYYSGLAIGFGVVGGLMLVGITALYIYLNKKNNNGQAA